MEGIDAEFLISLIEAKPVLWDKTLAIYKDRVATRKGWEEVYLSLNPDFESTSDVEKKAFGKEVIRRWTNIRDSFAKSKRDARAANKSGTGARKKKKYVFSDQLEFLNKIYTDSNTVDSLDSEIEPGVEITLEEAGEPEVSGAGEPRDDEAGGSSDFMSGNENLLSKNASSKAGKRKHNKPDEVELKILKALEPKTPCSKMSFLQSSMPHLTNFIDREFLQFQMGVLNVIENINKTKETISHHHQHYSSFIPSYQPGSQYMSQLPPVIQEQTFSHTQQPSFPTRQSTGPNYVTKISNAQDQHNQLPSHLSGPQHPSKSTHQTTSPYTITPSKKQTDSTSQYLQGFCYSDSSQSGQSGENVATPAISPSGESTYSDIFS